MYILKLAIVSLLGNALTVAAEDKFPPPLTSKTFQNELSTGLHLVEFFSPYCHHCKDFAPIWEKTWEDFHIEGARLGVGMAQVDCVESGDLCNKEHIAAYPSLKLYGPNGFIKNFPKSYKRNQEDVIKFLKEQSLELNDPNSQIDSKSVLITTDKMIKYLAEPIKKPILISLWPSSDLGEDITTIDPTKFKTTFDEEAIEFQRVWNRISNHFNPNELITGHFNCLSNKKICGEFSINTLLPNVILILPDLTSGKVIKYDTEIYDLEAKEVIENVQRFINISKAKKITAKELIESQKVVTVLPVLPEVPSISETVFVYLYDEETVTQEDLELLPYLTEPLSKLPNTQLFTSNDSSILEVVKLQKQNVYRIVGEGKGEGKDGRGYNEQRSTIESLSTLPTLISFKEYGLVPEVYHSFNPNEIRDQFRVIDWLKEQSTPYFMEFSGKTSRRILKGEGELIIGVLDKSQGKEIEEATRKSFYHLLVGYQDYLDLKDEERYQKILNDRDLKMNKVLKLKEAGAESGDIIKELSKEIPYKRTPFVQLTYIDIKNVELLKAYGWNIDNKTYKNGDVLVINKKGKFYYDTDTNGEALNAAEDTIKFVDVLSIVTGVKSGSVKKNLIDSPYSSSLRFLDYIHRFGFIGYLTVIIFVFLSYRKVSSLRQKKRTGRGILDEPGKFD